MKLKSFGCSFIFGTDLADDGRESKRPSASNLTWPAQIAKKLSYQYQCYARPGAGNLQIMEQVLNQCADPEPSMFVIGWTWIDRFDYYNAHWNPGQSLSPWQTIMPIDQDALATTYYRDLHSEYRDKLTNLTYIKLVLDTLQQKNIPLVMTYMDRLLFDKRWHVTSAVTYLQNHIESAMTLFDSQTFLEYSRSNNFEISDRLHPLELAHASGAEVIWPVFDKQKIAGPAQQARV
jgi:hypothetical protein